MEQQKKVIVYSTKTCPWCERTKWFLEENSVDYEDYNVAEDKNARDEMIQKSGQMGVPVIDIDGHIIVGYIESELRAKLGLA